MHHQNLDKQNWPCHNGRSRQKLTKNSQHFLYSFLVIRVCARPNCNFGFANFVLQRLFCKFYIDEKYDKHRQNYPIFQTLLIKSQQNLVKPNHFKKQQIVIFQKTRSKINHRWREAKI